MHPLQQPPAPARTPPAPARDKTVNCLEAAKPVICLKSLNEDELLLDLRDAEVTVIKPGRSVRQGCSLSPMFFNIVMDIAFRTAKERMYRIIQSIPENHKPLGTDDGRRRHQNPMGRK